MNEQSNEQRSRRKGRPPRISEQRWLELQTLWEREPAEDYATIGARVGLSKERVRQKAAEMGWQKKPDLARIVRVAHTKADAHFDPQGTDGEAGPSFRQTPQAPSPRLEAEANERASELRAQVALRHRKEWGIPRSLLNEAIKARDLERAKLSKLTAETLKLCQDGERKAWGMDEPEANDSGDSGVVTVVIRREEKALPARA